MVDLNKEASLSMLQQIGIHEAQLLYASDTEQKMILFHSNSILAAMSCAVNGDMGCPPWNP